MPNSVYELILFQARQRPKAIAVFSYWGTVTYDRLVQDTDRLAAELHERGVHHGPAIVVMRRSYVHLLTWLALDRLGIPALSLRAMPSELPWKSEEPIPIISGTEPSTQINHQWIPIGENWKPQGTGRDLTTPRAVTDNDLVHIIMSSGSTGLPKAVPFARHAQLARIQEHIRDFGLSQDSRFITSHPMSNGPCYWAFLGTLAVGGMVILVGSLADILGHGELLSATHMSCSPHALTELLKATSTSSLGLTSMTWLEVTGSMLPKKVAQEAQLRLTPNLYTLYGSTEVGRAAFSRVGALKDIDAAVGFVSPWVDLEIVDDDDNVLSAGNDGKVRVRNLGAADCYYQDHNTTDKFFKRGWFYPGDIGVVEKSGILRILGRVDDVINAGGDKVSSVQVEEKLRSVAGVMDAAVFGVPDATGVLRVCAAIVSSGSEDKNALKAVAQQARVSRLIFVKELPRNENGKVMKHLLSEQASRVKHDPTQSLPMT